MKKVLSLGLSFLIILSALTAALPFAASAADGKYTENGFIYEIKDQKAVITGYDGDEKYLNIVSELENGCTVTAIADSAFSGNLGIVSLNCESNLESVGDYAFEACSHLKTVTLSGALASVGKGAFSDCTSLESVELNKNVKSIGDGAFLFDKNLRYFGFPKNLESIGEYAFAFSGLSNVIMNNTIKTVPDRLFYGCGDLRNVSLPKNLKKIGDYAFAVCSKLDIDGLPESLDVIGDYAFNGCALSSIEFNGSEIGEGAFSNLSDTLETVKFSDNLKKVGKLAFESTKASSFELPDNITLENGAFAGVITDKYSIGKSSESYVAKGGVVYTKDKKTLVCYPKEKGYDPESDEENPEFVYEIPNGTESIAPYAFMGADLVTEVKMPDTLKKIGSHAFFRAGLKKVNIPDSVKSVADYAFSEVQSARELSLGSVEKIGKLSFYAFGEEQLTAKIPDTLKEFDPDSFLCTGIRFAADKKYKAIDGALYSADGKTLLCLPKSDETVFTVPDTVEKIARRALALNDTATKLVIPDGLKSIGEQSLEYYINYSDGYEALKFKDGMYIIGNASKDVKEYADNHNIGVFSAEPTQNIESVTLKGKETADFVIKGVDADDVVYSSNNDKIASVSDSGKITGLSKGSTYVTAAIGTTYFKCKVNVTSDSGIKYTGFDDSNYRRITPKTYELWRENYLSHNSGLADAFDGSVDESAMSAYQSESFYTAMFGVNNKGTDFYNMALRDFGEGFEPMISILNHACDTELKRHKATDSLILYSGAEPYASRFIAGESNTLKNLKAAKGTTFKHPEYVSTTLSPNVAHNFYSKGEGVMYIVYAEKSALDNAPSGLIAALHSAFEYEQLLAPWCEYEVIDAGVRWFENSEWKEDGEDDIGAYQRYVKLRLLGGKDSPDKLPTPAIKIKSAPKTMYIKGKADMKFDFVNTYDHNASFKSSDTKIVKVSKSGELTAVKKGKATITVSNSETKAVFKVTVKNPTLNKTKRTLKKGKTFTLKIKGGVGKASFKSKNKKIATVSSKGKIKAKKKGNTVITVKTNGITLKCKVKVKSK